jgi:hypothetical protein
MNDNVKKVLLVIGVIAIYHYFFRSMKPGSTTSTDVAGGIADDIANGIDTISTNVIDPLIGIIGSDTPIDRARTRPTHGRDSHDEFRASASVKVLQG